MDDKKGTSGSEGPRVKDAELIAVLRRAKKEHGLPALVTSQFNEIGNYDYSGTALNDRLLQLHDEGIIGHKKAGNRHLWWHSGEGSTKPVQTPDLESLIDYEEIDPSRFTEQQAKEIAAQNISGFEENWWQRIDNWGKESINIGVIIFLVALGLLLPDSSAPNWVIATATAMSLTILGISILMQFIGVIGGFLEKFDKVPAEPFGGQNLGEYVWEEFVPL